MKRTVALVRLASLMRSLVIIPVIQQIENVFVAFEKIVKLFDIYGGTFAPTNRGRLLFGK